MRRFFVVLVFLLVNLCVYTISEAQTEVSCETQMYVTGDVDIETFDYIYVCDTDDCYPEDYMLCHFQWVIQRLEQCEINDLFCRNEVQLTIVAQYIRGDANFGLFLPTLFVDDFPQVITAFSAGDFETALILLQDSSYDYYFPLIPYSRGLIYEMLNQPDEVLREYSRALDFIPNNTLIHYMRGLLYGRLGRLTEASFETAWLEDYLTAFAPSLLPLVAPLTEAYPLDMSRFSTWIRYPVMRNIHNQGGNRYFDGTQLTAKPIQIGIFDELGVMLAIDIAELHFPHASGDILNTYILQEMGNDTYFYRFPLSEPASDEIILEFRDGLYWGKEGRSPVAHFILAPPDYPDPRRVFGEPICEGGVISRLRPGMYVSEAGYNGGFAYSITSGGVMDQHFDDVQIHVTNDFNCIGSELWWEITDGQGNFGWRAENIGLEYQINPYYGQQEFFYCPNAPTTRLYIQGNGRVVSGLGINNLRSEPNIESEILTTISEGEQIKIIDGPICMNDMVWWQVEYGETTGWTAEGFDETYWIEPIFE